MGRGVGEHKGVGRVVDTGSYEEILPGTNDSHVLDEYLNTLPLIEISDKDYRSFCWPCHALEETGDCQSGS